MNASEIPVHFLEFLVSTEMEFPAISLGCKILRAKSFLIRYLLARVILRPNPWMFLSTEQGRKAEVYTAVSRVFFNLCSQLPTNGLASLVLAHQSLVASVKSDVSPPLASLSSVQRSSADSSPLTSFKMI